MKDAFDTALLESGELMRRGVRAIVENVGKVVALITVAVTALVLFCDVGFADFRGERFTSTLVIMLLASYLMYFSMYDTGEEAGKRCDEFKTANARYKSLTERIEGRHLTALRAYLTSYAEEEARFRRCSVLMQYGLSLEEYEAYKNGSVKTGGEMRAFRRADRIKVVAISVSTLLVGGTKRKKSEISDPESGKILNTALKLLPMTVCSLFTVSVMLTTKEGLCAADVIEGLFKIASLVIIGLRGYFAGYNYRRLTLPVWLETKSRLLDAFLKATGDAA